MIKSSRLNIRRFLPTDYENLRLLDSDHEVMRFTGPGTVQTELETRQNLKRFLNFEGDLGRWVIESNITSQFLGFLMLKECETREIELGYVIKRSCWGNGYASDAVDMILSWYSKRHPDVNYTAKTTPDNFASQRILEKCGFKKQTLTNSSSIKTLVTYKLSL